VTTGARADQSRFTIRRANAEDAQAISAIHQVARKKAMPWLPVVHSPQSVLAFFTQQLATDEEFTVAIQTDKVCGFIARDGTWINHMYVHPDFWGKGCGSSLLFGAKEASPELQLWVFQENTAARGFYQSRGFTDVELTDGAGNEEKTPDVRMSWTKAD